MKPTRAYKGYLILSTLRGETYIEKNKQLVSWANNELAAKQIINDLVEDNCKKETT